MFTTLVVVTAIASVSFTLVAMGYRLIKDKGTRSTASASSPLSHVLPAHPDRDEPNGIATWLTTQVEYYRRVIEAEEVAHLEETPIVREWLFYTIIFAVAISLVAIGMAISYMMPSEMTVLGLPFNPKLFAFLPIIAYIIVGFRSVGINEVAGADVFGIPVMQFGPGLKWIPFIWMNFNKEPGIFIQAEFPGDADHIQWSDEKTELKPNKVRPIYILTDENHKGTLPTELQMTVGVAALAKFQLIPERFFDLFKNVGPIHPDKEAEIRFTMTGGKDVSPVMLEVVRNMRDTTATILLDVGGKLSLNEIRKYQSLINQLLFMRLQKLVTTWGIRMNEVGLTKVNPGHDFNDKIQARADAEANRDIKIREAEGEKRKRILEGEGAAAAELALLSARAEGYKKIAETAKTVAGKVAISADVAGKLAGGENNTVVVGADGVKELLSIVAASKKVK